MIDIGDKVPVTFRALFQRMNRHLGKHRILLKKSRTQDGPYFLVNLRTNEVERLTENKDVLYAKKERILQPWEYCIVQ